jgi:hypothetical protein
MKKSILILRNNAWRCFFTLGSNKKIVLDPKEERLWTTLTQVLKHHTVTYGGLVVI